MALPQKLNASKSVKFHFKHFLNNIFLLVVQYQSLGKLQCIIWESVCCFFGLQRTCFRDVGSAKRVLPSIEPCRNPESGSIFIYTRIKMFVYKVVNLHLIWCFSMLIDIKLIRSYSIYCCDVYNCYNVLKLFKNAGLNYVFSLI